MSMKMQKLATLLIAMVTVLTVLTVPASAICDVATDDSGIMPTDDGGIMPHYALCPDCGGEIRVSPTMWSDEWMTYKKTSCVHYPHGDDFVLINYGLSNARCNGCGYGSSTHVSRTKTECKGYNFPK